ncbi:peptidase M48-like protein [Hoeflea halophila]|uniref:Peptidase M48-like protein n=1 Tax=Hoeflea halophila TaxID=714899 RepID=A0A286HVQ5_9HYPH|nr:M48 family metallopeptidase [Hoeflea halophila]SOE11871.1 peptidase M48-like protein [Hoeflea halophila]
MTEGVVEEGEPVSGRYFEPGSARAFPATMTISKDFATIRFERDGVAKCSVREIRGVGARLGSVPRRIELEGGALFEAPADAEITVGPGRASPMLARVFRLESSWRTVAILVVATSVLVAVIFRYGMPVMANVAARVTPAPISAIMDAGTLETVDRTLFSATELSAAEQRDLTERFTTLAPHADTGSRDLVLLFRSSPLIGANAFALPGGTVIMTDELIAVARDDDEIDGVLAHEIAHVEARHTLQTIYRAAGLAIMVGVIAGDSGQMVDTLLSQAAALQQLSYSRAFEIEADLRSVELMLAAGEGRNPLAFIDLLDRLVEEMAPGASEQEEGFFSTHPGNPNRRETVLQHARSLGWDG